MKINSLEERQKFLDGNIDDVGSYAIATYNNITEIIWITRFKEWAEDGSDWFLESPCELWRHEDGESITYEIDAPQTSPFLPEIIDDIVLISEETAINLLKMTMKL